MPKTTPEKVAGRLIVEIRAKDFTANTFANLGKQLKTVNKQVKEQAKETQKSLGLYAKGVKDVRNVFAYQLKHYLSFTVGVYIVRGTITALRNMGKLAMEFQDAAYAAASVSGYWGKEFDKAVKHIEKVSIEVARTTKFTSMEVANSFYTLASAGYDVMKITSESLKPIMDYATAVGIDLAQATKNIIVVMKQFHYSLEDVNKITDVLTSTITHTLATADSLAEAWKYVGPAAHAVGMSFEEAAAALGILINNGVQGSQAGQMLRMVLLKLLDPTKEAQRAFWSMGYSLEDLSPRTHSLTEILKKLRTGYFDASKAAQIFSARSALGAIILSQNIDELEKLTKMLRESSGVTKEIAEKRLATMEGQLKLVKSAYEALSLTITKNLQPALTAIGFSLKNVIFPVLSAFANVINGILGAIKSFADTSAAFKFAILGLVTSLSLLAVAGTTAFLVFRIYKPMVIGLADSMGLLGLRVKFLLPLFLLVGAAFGALVKHSMKSKEQMKLFTKRLQDLITALTIVIMTFSIYKRLAQVTILTNKGLILSFAHLKDTIAAGIETIALLNNSMKVAKFGLFGFLSGITLAIGSLIFLIAKFKDLNNTQRLGLAVITAIGTALSALVLQIKGVDAVIKGILASNPIGWILLAVGAIVGLLQATGKLGAVLNAVGGAFQDFLAFFGIGKSRAEMFEIRMQRVSNYMNEANNLMKEYADNERKLAGIEADLKSLTTATDAERKKRNLLENEYSKLIARQAEIEKRLSEIRSGVRANLLLLNKDAKKYLQLQDKLKDVESDLQDLYERKAELDKRITKTAQEYIDTLNEQGGLSADLVDKLEEYNSEWEEYSKLITQIGEKENDQAIITKQLRALWSKMSTTVQDAISSYNALNKAYSVIILLTTWANKIQNIWNELKKEDLKYSERLKRMYHAIAKAELKIDDAEKRLIKDRQNLYNITDKLFRALASQGVLTEDQIQAYSKLKQKQTEQIKWNRELTTMLSKYSDESKEKVRLFMREYINNIMAGQDAQEAWANAMSKIDLSQVLTTDDLKVLQNYEEFTSTLINDTQNLNKSLGDTADTLVESGNATTDTIDAWSEYHKWSNQIISDNQDLSDSLQELRNNMAAIASAKVIHAEIRWGKFSEKVPTWISSRFGEAVFKAQRPISAWKATLETFKESGDETFRSLAEKISQANINWREFGTTSEEIESNLDAITQTIIDALGTSTENAETLARMFVETYLSAVQSKEAFYDLIEPPETIRDILIDINSQWTDAINGANNLVDALSLSDTIVNRWKTIDQALQDFANYTEKTRNREPTQKISPLTKISNWILNIMKSWGWRVELPKIKNQSAGGAVWTGQEGGIVTKPTLSLIGEAGPEAVIPLRKFRIQSASKTFNIYGDIHIESVKDIDEFMEELERRIALP